MQGGKGAFDGAFIHQDTVISAEAYIAGVEGRAIKPAQKIAMELRTEEGTIYYTAAILRQAMDVYKNQGFDISQNCAILATLYNLGKVDQRAADLKAKGAGAQPRVNFFGFFIEQNREALAPFDAPLLLAPILTPAEPATPAPTFNPGVRTGS